jgi:hypothetical protein
MDRIVDEIALVRGLTQNQDDEALNMSKLRCETHDQSKKCHEFIR